MGIDNCHEQTLPKDANIPFILVSLGVLSAIACASLWPRRRIVLIFAGAPIGLLLAIGATMTPLPAYVLYLFPLLTTLGATTVAVSMVRIAAPAIPVNTVSV
jgi:hypothetical protein